MDVLGEALDRLRGLRPAQFARERRVLAKQLELLALLAAGPRPARNPRKRPPARPPARPRKSRAAADEPARIVLPLGVAPRRRVVALLAAEGPLDLPAVAERLGIARHRAGQLVWQAVAGGELACGEGHTFVAASAAGGAAVRRRSRSEPGPPPRGSSSGG